MIFNERCSGLYIEQDKAQEFCNAGVFSVKRVSLKTQAA